MLFKFEARDFLASYDKMVRGGLCTAAEDIPMI